MPSAKSARERWKTQEREVARILGCRRKPVNGRGDEDLDHPRFWVEVKTSGRGLPSQINEAFEQVKGAVTAGKIPLVAFCHVRGQGRPVKRYVIMELAVFAELIGVSDVQDSHASHQPDDAAGLQPDRDTVRD